jgi:hypothetical protein
MRKILLLVSTTIVVILSGGYAQATASVPVWGPTHDDLRFPANRLGFVGARNPAWAVFRDDGAASRGVYALQFGDENPNEEEVVFDAQMPHGWVEGTAVGLHVHMSPEDATTCNYRVCAEYTVANNGAAFPTTTGPTCTDIASSEDATELSYEPVVSISMTGKLISSIIKVRLFRNSSHANDTCDGKYLWIHEADIHYQTNTPGSRQEMVK